MNLWLLSRDIHLLWRLRTEWLFHAYRYTLVAPVNLYALKPQMSSISKLTFREGFRVETYCVCAAQSRKRFAIQRIDTYDMRLNCTASLSINGSIVNKRSHRHYTAPLSIHSPIVNTQPHCQYTAPLSKHSLIVKIRPRCHYMAWLSLYCLILKCLVRNGHFLISTYDI